MPNIIEVVAKFKDEASEKLNKLVEGFSSFRAIGVGLVGVGVYEAFAKIEEAIEENQRAALQLSNALRTMGDSAGYGAKQAEDLAEAIASTTTFSADAAKSAEAVALRFGIAGDQMERVTRVAADLAAGTGQDLVSAMEELGRAAARPETAFRLLQQAGVALTGAQQFQIREMSEAGDRAGAFKIILDKLAQTYQGNAAAARDTLGGALSVLKNQLQDFFSLRSDQTSGLSQGILDVAAGVGVLKRALEGALGPQDKLSDGMKNLAAAALLLKAGLLDVWAVLKDDVGSIFEALGNLLGGNAAVWDQFLHGNFKQAFETFKQVWSDTADILDKGGQDAEASIQRNQDDLVDAWAKLYDAQVREVEKGAEKLGKAGGGSGGPSEQQLQAIKALTQSLTTDIAKNRAQATQPLEDIAAALDEIQVRAALAKVGLKDLPTGLQQLLKDLNASRGEAAQRQLLDSLHDQTEELKLQAQYGDQAGDAIDRYRAQVQLAQQGVAQLGEELQRAFSDKNRAANQATLRSLQDQLDLVKETANQQEVTTNLRKLSADATDDEKASVVALTKATQNARYEQETYNEVVSDVKDEFKKMVDEGTFSFKQLGLAILRTLTDRAIFKAIDDIADALSSAFKSSGSSSSGSSGSGWASLIGSVAKLFSAGGGETYGPTVVGEEGPEVVSPTGAGGLRTWNSRQLAFAGAGGGNVSFAPSYSVQIVGAKDDEALRREFYEFVYTKTERDKQELYRMLNNNGYRLR